MIQIMHIMCYYYCLIVITLFNYIYSLPIVWRSDQSASGAEDNRKRTVLWKSKRPFVFTVSI